MQISFPTGGGFVLANQLGAFFRVLVAHCDMDSTIRCTLERCETSMVSRIQEIMPPNHIQTYLDDSPVVSSRDTSTPLLWAAQRRKYPG